MASTLSHAAEFHVAPNGKVSSAIDSWNVVWTSASKDSSGSMPLGNGDIGVNVWVEKDGDLLLYLGKTDSWDERGRLLKLGRVRVRFEPNPFKGDAPFRQELRLKQGEIVIAAGPSDSEMSIRLWVDAHHPVIRVEAHGRQPFSLKASMETWRAAPQSCRKKEAADSYVEQFSSGEQPILTANVNLPPEDAGLIWHHRNERSVWPVTLRLQGLESLIPAGHDPLLHRTFGGLMRGAGLVNDRAQRTDLKHSVQRF